MSRST
jgi:hypothetical protein